MRKLLFIISFIFTISFNIIPCYADIRYGWFLNQDTKTYEFMLKDFEYFLNKCEENPDLLKFIGCRQDSDGKLRLYAKDGFWLIDERLYLFDNFKLQFASNNSSYKIDKKTGQVQNNQNKYYTGKTTTSQSTNFNGSSMKDIMDTVGKLYANTPYSQAGRVPFTYNGKKYLGQRPDCSGMCGTIGAVYKVENGTLTYIADNMNLEYYYKTSTSNMTGSGIFRQITPSSLSALQPGDVLTHDATAKAGVHAIMLYSINGNTYTFIEKTSNKDGKLNYFPVNANSVKIVNGKIQVRDNIYTKYFRITG